MWYRFSNRTQGSNVGIVLILGETADDKGSQLEQLVQAILEQQDYKKVRSNVVGAGGNELDVIALRESKIGGGVQITPLMCEAKAKADPVDMPMWQRFLGKLFIERAKDSTAVGMLVALNGVNGNVAGSFLDLKRHDSALFIFEGADLIAQAILSRQIDEEMNVARSIAAQYKKIPSKIEVAYYRGAFLWVVRWNDDEYSVVDGHGDMMLTESVARLRGALQATIGGALLATEEARAQAEERHRARLEVINDLFRGREVSAGTDLRRSEAVASLIEEPYTTVTGGKVRLAPPSDLDAASVARLFVSMLEGPVRVPLLSFMIEGYHGPYVARLVDVLPDLQGGFSLDKEEAVSLQQIAALFPSVWLTITTPISFIATHRGNQPDVDDVALSADRAFFWRAVGESIRSDHGNASLHGFLYDYLHVAEIEERTDLIIKSKSGPVGMPIHTVTRDAVRQYTDDSIGESGPVFVMVRLLPGVAEPWDSDHPEPEFPLEEAGDNDEA